MARTTVRATMPTSKAAPTAVSPIAKTSATSAHATADYLIGPPTQGVEYAPRVLIWPRWFDNPYLPCLVNAFRDEGLRVSTPFVLGLGSMRLRSGDWLHGHWTTEAHRDCRQWLYKARAAMFRRQIQELKDRGVRIAWTAHNLVPHDDPYPELGRRARQDLLDLCDHVFIHFPGAKAILADEFGYRGPTTVVHHPHYVDSHPAPPTQSAAREELGLPADGFVALSFGLIRPYKGIDDIIAAFQQIARPNDRLLLAGNPEGDVAAELEAARRDPRIILQAKHIPKDEVPTYFAAADATVIAHRAFFTSGSALLSLSMGCPIVGPAVNHLADLAGGQRLYPAQLGVEGLAAGMVEARDKAHQVDRGALRQWAAEYGDWHEAAARSAAVFRD